MKLDGWTAEDSAERRQKLDYAEMRLSGWAAWSGLASPDMVGHASASSFVRAMTPSDEEMQAGARHCASECSDEEALEVDSIVSRWSKTSRGWWKVVHKEYFTGGPQEKKARELGLNRDTYRARLAELQFAIAVELEALRRERHDRALALRRRFAKSSGRVGPLPPKNA